MTALLSTIISCLVNPSVPNISPSHGLPSPRLPHLTLEEDAIGGKRIIIIGDVHGCYDELQEMLALTEACRDDTVVLCVGDLVNKGPKSKEVLNLVRSMRNVHSVRGNHDEAVLREYASREKDSNHVLRDKHEWITALDESERDFLTELPYTITIPSRNILIVHAGLVPGKHLSRQKARDMITMRNAVFTDYFDGTGWQGLSSGDDMGYPWASLWPGPYHIYFGHDAKRKLQLYDYATGLDTGCVYGGCLTAAVLDPDVNVPVEFVTVKAQALYRQK